MKSKTQYALTLTEERSNGFFHLRGRIVELDGSKGTTYPRDAWPQDLEINSQGDDRTYTGRTDQRALYCWEVRYRPYSVDLRDALRMVKTLQKIERGLAKLDATRGRSHDYGDYVGRVCEILGIGTIIVSSGRFSEDRRPVGEGVQHIRHLLAVWVREGQPAPDSAAV